MWTYNNIVISSKRETTGSPFTNAASVGCLYMASRKAALQVLLTFGYRKVCQADVNKKQKLCCTGLLSQREVYFNQSNIKWHTIFRTLLLLTNAKPCVQEPNAVKEHCVGCNPETTHSEVVPKTAM